MFMYFCHWYGGTLHLVGGLDWILLYSDKLGRWLTIKKCLLEVAATFLRHNVIIISLSNKQKQ